MAGVAQVWLTEKELEAIAEAFDILELGGRHLQWTKYWTTAQDKVEMALKPVACKVATD